MNAAFETTFDTVSVVHAADKTEIGPGSLGFWVVVALAVALFFLYRSMRKQMRKIDFDAEAESDEGRMQGHRPEPDANETSRSDERDAPTPRDGA